MKDHDWLHSLWIDQSQMRLESQRTLGGDCSNPDETVEAEQTYWQ